jgi:hypothetical protein
MKRLTIDEEGASRGPAGIPIRRALAIPPGIANDHLREAVAAIERVHGDGVLPMIPLSMVGEIVTSGRGRADGLFTFDVDVEGYIRPRSVQVSSDAPNRPWVAIHEIGHFLDASGLPGPGYASGNHDVVELDRRRNAVARSRAV